MAGGAEPAGPADGLLAVRALRAEVGSISQLDALRLADNLIAGFMASTDPATQVDVARLQLERGCLLAALGQPADALRDFSGVINRFAHHEVGAEALNVRAQLHHSRGNDHESLADLNLLVERYATSIDPGGRRHLALSRGFRLKWLADEATRSTVAQKWHDVAHAAQLLVMNHAEEADLTVQRCVARAMLWEARAWRELGADDDAKDAAEAMRLASDAADALFDRFASTADPELRSLVAHSETENESATSDARATLELTERMLSLRPLWHGEPAMFFARAACHRAWALDKLNEQEAAYQLLTRTVADHRGSTDPDVAAVVASVWADSIEFLRAAGQEDEAVLEADLLVLWLADRPTVGAGAAARWALAKALSAKVDILRAQTPAESLPESGFDWVNVDSPADPQSIGRPSQECEAAYAAAVADLVVRFAHDAAADVRARVASRLYVLAHHQRLRGNLTEAEAAYRTLIEHFASDPSPAIRENFVAPGELNLGALLLTHCGRPADAVAVYDEALARLSDATSSQMSAIIAKMTASRSAAVTMLNDRGLSSIDVERTRPAM